MRASFILCAAVVLLAGCGTAQERAAYREDPVLAMSQEYGPLCVEHGFAKGSESWRQCIIRSSTRADLMQQSLYFDRYMQWYWLR